MEKCHFSTKAANLEVLSGRDLKSAHILPLMFFTVSFWNESRTARIGEVKDKFGDVPLIVRSSCQNEDSCKESNAGAFLSIKNVSIFNLEEAVEDVIASYIDESVDNQILIQPMLQNVVRSGVAFSHDPRTCSPYRVINWVDTSDTSHITSGKSGRTWQAVASSAIPPPSELAGVICLMDELLQIYDGIPLDCEFAVTKNEFGDETLWLLQVRPLIIHGSMESVGEQRSRVRLIADKVEKGMQEHPFLKGRKTVYGIMPDWNPAEIIGVRPKPFALSLYRELITDSIWAYQRHNYGYRNLRSFPLMTDFFGLPYIDVRVSFNSFIPANLDDELAERLVDHYISALLKEPAFHDKVEFEIVYSCYTFDLDNRLRVLKDNGFSNDDCHNLTNSLRELTNKIIDPQKGLWKKDAEKLEKLRARRALLLASDLDIPERIYWLLEDVKRYGTLPFAGLARAGFVAVQMLKSLVAVGVLSEEDYDNFLRSLNTVSGQLARDRFSMNKSSFLKKYGHLRPGTYDILSSRYDETPDIYFDWSRTEQHVEEPKPFSLTLQQMKSIAALMAAHELNHDVVGLFEFLQSAIELREWAKFEFTRSISDALSLMKDYAASLDVTGDSMAFCNISAFYKIHASPTDPRRLLQNEIEQGRKKYADTLRTVLPPLITSSNDVWAFEWPDANPNFITQKTVLAPVCGIEQPLDIEGKIVFIPNADPGFDWLFTYPIAGLVTAWGGVNSHMAIRTGELGIPAIIGAGQLMFQKWSQAKKICLYCAECRVEIIA